MAPNDPFINLTAGKPPQNGPSTFDNVNVGANHARSSANKDSRDPWTAIRSLLGNVKHQAAVSAVFYALGGINEFATINEEMGVPENTPGDAIFLIALVGIPTFLMVKRNGYISAGILCFIALMNAVGCYTEVQAGNPYYDEGSVFYNVFFLGIFAYAGWKLWKVRKVKT